MCDDFLEIQDKKIIKSKGKFAKGHWIVCAECGIINLKDDQPTSLHKKHVYIVRCPKCKCDISTMKNLTKKHKWNWTCKCGVDVSKIKLKQLVETIKKATGTNDKTVLSYLPLY